MRTIIIIVLYRCYEYISEFTKHFLHDGEFAVDRSGSC